MPSVELKKKLKGHSWQVSCLSFHPTNQLLASGSWDRTVGGFAFRLSLWVDFILTHYIQVRLWDINNEYKEISTFSRDVHQAPILSLAWHPNGQLLATGGGSTSDFFCRVVIASKPFILGCVGDNLTCIWDTTTATCVKTLKEHFGWILGVDFAPDRTKLATASWDRTGMLNIKPYRFIRLLIFTVSRSTSLGSEQRRASLHTSRTHQRCVVLQVLSRWSYFCAVSHSRRRCHMQIVGYSNSVRST
jgi:hypothetical protein